MIETKNAIITSATITKGDHNLLSAYVNLDYGGLCQSFGGYVLHVPDTQKNRANYAGLFLWRVMEMAGVDEWDKLPGKTIRVKAEWGKVHAIGHIVKDIWFNPTEEFEALKDQN